MGSPHTLGLTQQHLAERIGGSAQRVHKYETGGNCVSAGRLVHRLAVTERVEVTGGRYTLPPPEGPCGGP